MIITENLLNQILVWALNRTAESLEIGKDGEALTPEEMLTTIAASPPHLNALYEFVDAYLDWYRAHLKIDLAGKSGNLSPAERLELDRLIVARDQTRQALLDLTPLPDTSH